MESRGFAVPGTGTYIKRISLWITHLQAPIITENQERRYKLI